MMISFQHYRSPPLSALNNIPKKHFLELDQEFFHKYSIYSYLINWHFNFRYAEAKLKYFDNYFEVFISVEFDLTHMKV